MRIKTFHYCAILVVMAVVLSVSACSIPTSQPPPDAIPPTTPPQNYQPEESTPPVPLDQPLTDSLPNSADETSQHAFEHGWWLKPQTYGMFNYWNDTNLQRLEDTSSSVNGYRLVFDLDLINPNFDIAADIQRVHTSGRKYVVGITFNGTIDKWPEETSLLVAQGALALTYEGTPAVQQSDEKVYYFSTNHPAWQAALIDQGKSIVDAGADGITVIEPWGASFYPGFGGHPDFSKVSAEGFSKYLSERFTTTQLSAIGITNLNSFDYREYLRIQGVSAQDLTNAPLYSEYQAYQRQCAIDFFRRYVAEVKEYACSLGIEDFPIATAQHGGWLTPFTLDMLQYADFAFGNLDFTELENVYDTHAFQYKLHRAATGGPLIAAPMDMSLGWLVQKSAQPDNWLTVKAAEAYVNQGGFHDTFYAGLTENGPLEYISNFETVSRVFNFVLTNRDLLTAEVQSMAQVAVLLAPEMAQGEADMHWGTFSGTCRVLTASNIQYDVILDQEAANGIDYLDRYEVVILPNCSKLNQGMLFRLSQYGSNDGKLLAINQTPEGIVNVPGLIHINWYPDIQRQSIANNEFLEILAALIPEKVLLERLPDGIMAQIWRTGKSTVLHLINYNYSLQSGIVDDQFNVPVSINLPADLEVHVIIISPDFDSREELKFDIENGYIKFTVPHLHIWDVILIE